MREDDRRKRSVCKRPVYDQTGLLRSCCQKPTCQCDRNVLFKGPRDRQCTRVHCPSRTVPDPESVPGYTPRTRLPPIPRVYPGTLPEQDCPRSRECTRVHCPNKTAPDPESVPGYTARAGLSPILRVYLGTLPEQDCPRSRECTRVHCPNKTAPDPESVPGYTPEELPHKTTPVVVYIIRNHHI